MKNEKIETGSICKSKYWFCFLTLSSIITFTAYSWYSSDTNLATLFINLSFETPQFIIINRTIENDDLPLDRNKTKIILFWTPFFGSPQSLNSLNSCPELNCMLTNNRSYASESLAVIFHIRDFSVSDVPKQRYQWQRYIFQLYESPHNTYSSLHKMAGFFNWTMTYRLDSDLPAPYGYFAKLNKTNNSIEYLNKSEIVKSNKNFVAWMVSNCNTHSNREKYVLKLQRFISVDIYGSCTFAKFKCSKSNFTECNTMIGDNYRFYLAFENSICKDYITEKFYSRSHLNSVPIVLRRKIVENILPENSFIAADDFIHPKYLANYLKKLSGNDELYLAFFKWKTEGYTLDHQYPGHYENFCLTCQKLWAVPSEPIKVYTDIHSWWSGDGICDINFVKDQLAEDNILKG